MKNGRWLIYLLLGIYLLVMLYLQMLPDPDRKRKALEYISIQADSLETSRARQPATSTAQIMVKMGGGYLFVITTFLSL